MQRLDQEKYLYKKLGVKEGGRAFTQKVHIFGSFRYLQSLNPITAI